MNPSEKQYRQCAEWQKQKSVWLAWPWDESLWQENLIGAQKAVLELAKLIQNGALKVNMLIPNETWRHRVEPKLTKAKVQAIYHEIPYGDIWLRDIAPIFLKNPGGDHACACFRFNGWGEKYVLRGDAEVSLKIAQKTGYLFFPSDLILEGGAIEPDGQGAALTTKECLLHKNRNPKWSQKDLEKTLQKYLGLEHIIWLEKGLLFDHTDGHIDNIARFVSPGHVLCMEPDKTEDPQAEVLKSIISELKNARDGKGQKFEVTTLPSPGKVLDGAGEIMPASYLNFLISNDQVVVPLFQTKNDDAALKNLEKIFAPKKVTGIDCRDLLTGGGALHCITQPDFC